MTKFFQWLFVPFFWCAIVILLGLFSRATFNLFMIGWAVLA